MSVKARWESFKSAWNFRANSENPDTPSTWTLIKCALRNPERKFVRESDLDASHMDLLSEIDALRELVTGLENTQDEHSATLQDLENRVMNIED